MYSQIINILAGIGLGVILVPILIPLAVKIAGMKLDTASVDEFGIFFKRCLYAIPEELVFRYVLITCLSIIIPIEYSILIATTLFGLGHIIKFGWKFAIVAWVSGLIYTSVYLIAGNNLYALSASIVIHGFVNTLWASFFVNN